MDVLCSVCWCRSHDDLVEPILTSCGHLYCWPCIYMCVKSRGDFQCPMCRLLITAVTADLSRGTMRTEADVKKYRIPRRPVQGVFPFDFDRDEADFAVETQPVEGTESLRLLTNDEIEVPEPLHLTDDEVDVTEPLHLHTDDEVVQPHRDEEFGQLALRRSGRIRRTNTQLRDFEGFDYLNESAERESERVLSREARGDEMSVVDRGGNSLNGDDIEIQTGSPSSQDTELPETERRYLPYNIGPDARLNQDMEDESDIGDLGTGGDDEDLVEENHFLEDDSNLDQMLNPNDNVEDFVEDRVPRARAVSHRFNSKLPVEGDPHFTHIELALICILREMRSEHVKMANLNFTKLARAVRDERDGSFPGKALDQRAKYIRNILTKAKKAHEEEKPVLPRCLRADDHRNTRMEETISAILRLDSAAPVTARQTVRRGRGVRRPVVAGRPTIIGPGVGRISPPNVRNQVAVDDSQTGTNRFPGAAPSQLGTSSFPGAASSQSGTSSIPGAAPSQSGTSSFPGAAPPLSESEEVQDDYIVQRRVRQEQGAEIRERSLGHVRNSRMTNNRRLGSQLEEFSSAIQTLSSSRQAANPGSSYVANADRRYESRVRSRSEDRAERRTMDLLLVASATGNRELAASLPVGRSLVVFKRPDPDMNVSPDFPLTLKLGDISELSRNLKDYMDLDGVVDGVVIKTEDGFKSIITSCAMISFTEAYVEHTVKSRKSYILLTQK